MTVRKFPSLQAETSRFNPNYAGMRRPDALREIFRKEILFPDAGRISLLSEIKGFSDISARIENIEISERTEPVKPVIYDRALEKKPEPENSKAADRYIQA